MKQLLYVILIISLLLLPGLPVAGQPADATYQPLPFAQDWANTGLITTNDDWTGVPGILGYLGDYTTSSPTGVDPQTLLADYATTAVDVIANQTNTAITNGGVAEFQHHRSRGGLAGFRHCRCPLSAPAPGHHRLPEHPGGLQPA